MKKKNYFIEIVIRNIHYFVAFIILSYGLSSLVVRGADLISEAINDMLAEQAVDITALSITTLKLIIISMVFAFIKTVCGNMFSIRIQKELKELTVKNLALVKMSYIENNSGVLITKLTSDIGNMGELFSEIVPEIFQYTVTIITLGISIIIIDFRLMIGIILCYPIVLLISNKIAIKLKILAKNRRSKYDELTEAAQDAVSGIVVERAFSLYDVLNKKIDGIAEDILKNEYARNRIQAVSNGIENIMKWLPNMICTIFALAEVLSGNLSIGELVAFQVLLAKLLTPIGELPFRINDARELLVSMRRINDLMDAPKETGGIRIPEECYKGQNTITLENLSFWYDANPDRKILDMLNVSFEKGKITAIVGSSGAGKSTLFKILCGFELAKEGSYKFMGQNFDEFHLDAARTQIGIVTQNVFLFPDTIAENVSFGNRSASNELIESACKAACIHDYIVSLPEGYDTVVGERGANMSGGEKQRISIARALLKNAPVLLMDEPTSALDAGTETAITNVLTADELKKNKTIIIIVHRLSTIVNADKIIVMDQGKVVETGTHKELIDMDGIYAGLYKKETMHHQEVCHEA